MYGKCKYAHEIKWALNHKKKIIEVLNKYRREPLEDNWIPLVVYCEKCKRDTTKVLKYDGWHAFKDPKDTERFAEGLRKAGLPME